DDCTESCNGGDAGDLQLYSDGGRLVTSGAMALNGGDSPMGVGGDGGSIDLQTWNGESNWYVTTAAGSIEVSGTLTLRGGSGLGGGTGGNVDARLNVQGGANQQEII